MIKALAISLLERQENRRKFKLQKKNKKAKNSFYDCFSLFFFLEKEILYVDHLRWNEKDNDHLKLFK